MLAIFASTREGLIAALPLNAEQKTAFVRQQFEAQQASFQREFGNAEESIIVLDGEPIGRLYLAAQADRLCIVDIALLPPYRGRGFGTVLLTRILADADRHDRAVYLHVEPSNAARRLYERLGFRKTGEAGVYWRYERAVRATTV